MRRPRVFYLTIPSSTYEVAIFTFQSVCVGTDLLSTTVLVALAVIEMRNYMIEAAYPSMWVCAENIVIREVPASSARSYLVAGRR